MSTNSVPVLQFVNIGKIRVKLGKQEAESAFHFSHLEFERSSWDLQNVQIQILDATLVFLFGASDLLGKI